MSHQLLEMLDRNTAIEAECSERMAEPVREYVHTATLRYLQKDVLERVGFDLLMGSAFADEERVGVVIAGLDIFAHAQFRFGVEVYHALLVAFTMANMNRPFLPVDIGEADVCGFTHPATRREEEVDQRLLADIFYIPAEHLEFVRGERLALLLLKLNRVDVFAGILNEEVLLDEPFEKPVDRRADVIEIPVGRVVFGFVRIKVHSDIVRRNIGERFPDGVEKVDELIPVLHQGFDTETGNCLRADVVLDNIRRTLGGNDRHLLRRDFEIAHGDIDRLHDVIDLVGADSGAEVHQQHGPKLLVT